MGDYRGDYFRAHYGATRSPHHGSYRDHFERLPTRPAAAPVTSLPFFVQRCVPDTCLESSNG